MNLRSQRGVALIITLLMLAVVTFMAVTFLAVSRRERLSVSVTEEQSTSRLMADAALARAQAEVVGQMLTTGHLLAYGHQVSTNFINPLGFDPAQPAGTFNPTNVNYEYRLSAGNPPLTVADQLQNIANLQHDPRAPVYVATNEDPRTPLDFRFFLDLNRNARFETNGLRPVMSLRNLYYDLNGFEVGQPVNVLSNFFVGDPEWIGVLQYPDAPHSATNRFIGRYAFLVQPAGKSLDLNFAYSNTRDPDLVTDAFFRNQGYGSWELNLAAFLHDLNTNAWFGYAYNGLGGRFLSAPAEDALGILRYRYANDSTLLASVQQLFGLPGANASRVDGIDAYANGPATLGNRALQFDNDYPRDPWPGSDNPRRYFELSELLDTNTVPVTFLQRLLQAQNYLSSYDRYTFHRLLAQMGTDSVPANRGKVNLNYDNAVPLDATNHVPWTPVRFFTNAASRLFELSRLTNVFLDAQGRLTTNYVIGDTYVRREFDVTNISLYPLNEYTATIHRLLQLAVNLYDATTNRLLTPYPHVPTVLRPVFGSTPTNLYIAGYSEATNTAFLNNLVVRDLLDPADRLAIEQRPLDSVVYDVPLLIGAKKGFPNFNEFSLQNVAQVTRKLEVRKPPGRPNDRPIETNQMYLIGLSNSFGIEAWNSYTQDFPRPLRLTVSGEFRLMLTNQGLANSILHATNVRYFTNLAFNAWPSNRFLLPVHREFEFVPTATYYPLPRPTLYVGTNFAFRRGEGFYIPEWQLDLTNRFYYALVDPASDRLVDFVAFGRMISRLNLTREVMGRAQLPALGTIQAEPANLWQTNRAGGALALAAPTVGVQNQMQVSLGNTPVDINQWRSYNATVADKDKSIDLFRVFCGLTPLTYPQNRVLADLRGKEAMQAPFSPTRKILQQVYWQANDPLVHYTVQDLLDPFTRPDDPYRSNAVQFVQDPNRVLVNQSLGRLNARYRPWGGNPYQSTDILAQDARVKDPMVERSDDWQFPTNKFPTLGWLGRVHRGSPWQTVYLKSGVVDTNNWFLWAGSYGTHPTNDWSIVEAFTVAPNDNAARGLLGVNQTNLAAWSAVLSGIPVLTNTTPLASLRTNGGAGFQQLLLPPDLPGSPQLRQIVAGINRTRDWETNRLPLGRGWPLFEHMGRLLATPELTMTSPFLSTDHLVDEFILECLPQQILSLVKSDEPRFVVYSFGQALKEAPNSLSMAPGAFNRLCTNYQVKGEFVTRSVIRLEGPVTSPRAVVESYNELRSE